MNDKSLLFRAESDEKLRKAAQRYLGEEMTAAQPLSGGLFNTTYRLETEKSKVILRLGPVNRHLLLPYERNLMASEGDILNLLKSGIIKQTTTNKIRHASKTTTEFLELLIFISG